MRLVALLVLLTACARHRAILVSFDALNERRALETVPADAIPALRALFDSGACADYAVPAWPSKTAASHASLWTGAYGDVNGVAANWQPPVPRAEHRITEGVSGYAAATLRAEPIWATAARAGRRVVGHHPTQAPGKIDDPDATVLNGYNGTHLPDLAITARTAPPRAATGWRHLGSLGATLPPREIAWAAGGDSIFALLFGRERYDAVLVAHSRDAAEAVRAEAAPAERRPLRGRDLAVHFSEPLVLQLPEGRAYLCVRLFELAPDGSDFLIFQPALAVVEANRPADATAYGDAIGGWVGNGAQGLLREGALGPTLQDGGDGEAELRYLESLELVTRQFMRGSEWGWRKGPDLMIDYFPLVDEVDHLWYGYVADGSYPAIQAMRARAWTLADLRLAGLRELVARDGRAALFVSGDHGMRATWRLFRPNAALARAGLLGRAYSPDGLYITVNSTDWLAGTVPPDSVAAVVAAADSVIRAVRGDDGEPVVRRTWRVTGHDSLGRGGAAGGDLYYETAPGYAWSRDSTGTPAGAGRIGADHGYPSTSPDMHTVFCGIGGGLTARRLGPARTIDVAPTVSAWLGMPPPRDARGTALR